MPELTLLIELKNALPTLLHPLSHYDLSTQVYKTELEDVHKLISSLNLYLRSLQSQYRLFIPEGRRLLLNFIINATDTGYYEVFTKETLYLVKDVAGIINLSSGECHCKKCYTISGGNTINTHNFASTDELAQYTSFTNSYNKIYDHIHVIPAYAHIPRAANLLTEFQYQDNNGNHSIEHHKNSFVW